MAARPLAILAMLLALAGCGDGDLAPDVTTFRLGAGVPRDAVASWRPAEIAIVVPESLTVSEDPDIRFPRVDLVWWEDPPGDRRAQVADVMREAVAKGVEGLSGQTPVTVTVTVNSFHALTPDALKNGTRGWHNVNFDIAVTDAAGTVLAAERSVDADIRALQGAAAEAALARGETQRSRIVGRVSEVVRRWFGLG